MATLQTAVRAGKLRLQIPHASGRAGCRFDACLPAASVPLLCAGVEQLQSDGG